MSTPSKYRTAEQADTVTKYSREGFVHDRDAEYRVSNGGAQTVVALSVLFGYARYAVVYPDGSAETRDRKRGGSKTVTFNKQKLAGAPVHQSALPQKQTALWKVYIIEDTAEKLIYHNRWMPTIDDMAVVAAVRGKKYKVLSPEGKDVTEHFRYGTPT